MRTARGGVVTLAEYLRPNGRQVLVGVAAVVAGIWSVSGLWAAQDPGSVTAPLVDPTAQQLTVGGLLAIWILRLVFAHLQSRGAEVKGTTSGEQSPDYWKAEIQRSSEAGAERAMNAVMARVIDKLDLILKELELQRRANHDFRNDLNTQFMAMILEQQKLLTRLEVIK